MNNEILNSLKAKLEEEYGGKGWEIELMEQLHKLRLEKVANIVSTYCSFMKISEINEIIGEVMEQWKKGKLEEFDKTISEHSGVGFYDCSYGFPLAKEAMISKAEEKLMAQVSAEHIAKFDASSALANPPPGIALVGPSEFLGAAAATLMQDTIEKERLEKAVAEEASALMEYEGAVKVEVIEPHEVLPPEPKEERKFHGHLIDHPPEAMEKDDSPENFLDEIIADSFSEKRHGRKARVVKQVERKEGTEDQKGEPDVDFD